MKISKLIKELQNIKLQSGDIPVYVGMHFENRLNEILVNFSGQKGIGAISLAYIPTDDDPAWDPIHG